MKHFYSIAAVVCAFALHAAPQVTLLHSGENIVSTPGEIVGVECMTADASQVVTAKVVVAVTETTNAYKTVSVPHTRYDIVLTNWNGTAQVITNTLDTFSYNDWIAYGTNHLVSVRPVATNIATQIADGARVKATYTKDIVIGTGTASSHYLLLTPSVALPFFGGRVDVYCGKQDNIKILVK